MAKKIKILSDSCCDLSKDLLERYEIDIMPLYVILGDKTYRDGVDVSPQMLYEYFEKTNETPKTAACNIVDFEEFFGKYAAEYDIIYMGIGAAMSCTLQNARIAAQSFPESRIFCVDSANLSTGIGLSLIRAAEMVQTGMDAADIVKELEALVPRVRSSFVLERLEYLHRGGRCSLLALLGAQMLNIKPEIAVKDGAMYNRSKIRGSIALAAHKYASALMAGKDNIEADHAFVTYTQDSDPDVVEAVYEAATASGHFKNVYKTNAGCVITSHCGRNCIGLLYIEKA